MGDYPRESRFAAGIDGWGDDRTYRKIQKAGRQTLSDAGQAAMGLAVVIVGGVVVEERSKQMPASRCEKSQRAVSRTMSREAGVMARPSLRCACRCADGRLSGERQVARTQQQQHSATAATTAKQSAGGV